MLPEKPRNGKTVLIKFRQRGMLYCPLGGRIDQRRLILLRIACTHHVRDGTAPDRIRADRGLMITVLAPTAPTAPLRLLGILPVPVGDRPFASITKST